MPIRVKANRDYRFRCGVRFGKVAQTFPDEKFSDAQLEDLRDDPRLTVEIVEDDGAARHEQLVAAMAKLDKANQAQWTNSGLPQTGALEELTGLAKVTAAERDAAWKEFNNGARQ